MLRSGALSDDRVIETVNRELVPVWINVREEAIPDVPALEKVTIVGHLDEHRRVADGFNGGFFVRSAVVTPDGSRLLNPQPESFWGSVGSFYVNGHYSYAQTEAPDYLTMIAHALDRYRFCEEHPLAACL